MLKGILLTVISVLAVIVAVRLLYAIFLLLVMLVSAMINGLVIPVIRGVFFVMLPVLQAIGFVITLPFRFLGAVFAPCRLAPASSLVLGPVCANSTCRCANPTEARFCRRCGATIAVF